MNTFMEDIINNLYNSLEIKKDTLIKEKLKEKGFGYLIETMDVSRFPKVVCEKCNGWSTYWANDGTEMGQFIVAIRDYEIDNTCEVNKVAASFVWKDELPEIFKK